MTILFFYIKLEWKLALKCQKNIVFLAWIVEVCIKRKSDLLYFSFTAFHIIRYLAENQFLK